MYVCVCVYVYIYIYIYTCTYTHTFATKVCMHCMVVAMYCTAMHALHALRVLGCSILIHFDTYLLHLYTSFAIYVCNVLHTSDYYVNQART
jgi:hypothetical protein